MRIIVGQNALAQAVQWGQLAAKVRRAGGDERDGVQRGGEKMKLPERPKAWGCRIPDADHGGASVKVFLARQGTSGSQRPFVP
jgi:hypothetical protein